MVFTLEKALQSTGHGITSTIRQGLELVAASRAYERLRQWRGKVKFSIDLKKLREDRCFLCAKKLGWQTP